VLITLLASVFLGFTVEAVAGFGSTVVTLALASHQMPVEEILVRFVPVNLLLSAWIVARSHRDIDHRWFRSHIVRVMLPGVLAGLVLARWGGPAWVRTMFAVFIVVLAAAELYATGSARTAPPLSPRMSRAAVALAGIIHGLFACGGPLLVYAAGRELTDKSTFRATLSTVWLLLNTVLVAGLTLNGKLSTDTLRGSALLLPALFAGAALGNWAHVRVPPATFRTGVQVLLLAAGLALLLR
jgi:uncharacterized membrane protein YfcA